MLLNSLGLPMKPVKTEPLQTWMTQQQAIAQEKWLDHKTDQWFRYSGHLHPLSSEENRQWAKEQIAKEDQAFFNVQTK